ncbi:transmembrane emp24 domain-containing protein 6-like [Oppia nitens]|uniref:transmembrane emp24 domain-containing protein 6-like n=1 Tax=Oppia nitens TaxID=1686743 RepID=UPI0023DC05BD|nr:transmembrane emp24 domain-containing protein 6-like [Oppia nitens]
MYKLIFNLIIIIIVSKNYCQTNCWQFSHQNAMVGIDTEFKVQVKPGQRDCYYQHFDVDFDVHVSMIALSGDELTISYTINGPPDDQQLLISENGSTRIDFSKHDITDPGIYSFCVTNTDYMFDTKMVSVSVWGFRAATWEKFVQAISEPLDKLYNMSDIMETVETRINQMKHHVERMQRDRYADWLLIKSNNSYVHYWSLVQCLVITVSAVVQVVFVKRLFASR